MIVFTFTGSVRNFRNDVYIYSAMIIDSKISINNNANAIQDTMNQYINGVIMLMQERACKLVS